MDTFMEHNIKDIQRCREELIKIVKAPHVNDEDAIDRFVTDQVNIIVVAADNYYRRLVSTNKISEEIL